MRNLLTPWRLKWYPLFILFALASGFLIAVFSGNGASTLSGRLGGDYPAFYSAGRIIAEGDWANLYNSRKQSAVQKEFFPGSSYQVFVNPPFWAAAYYPLSLINYRLSYTIHTLLMVTALLLAIWLISPVNGYIPKHYVLVICLTITYYPMFRAILGSQNTALSLLLIVLCWRAVTANREWLAGIALGLLLFKPQFALPLIGLHLLSGRWRVAMGSLPVAALLYGVGAYISGPFWISEWFKYANWAAQLDAVINADKAVCWLGFFQAILGQDNQSATIIGWTMTIITSAFLAFTWFIGGHRCDYKAQMGIATAALVLLSPHVMYYDTGILIFTLAVLAGNFFESYWKLPCLIWTLSLSQLSGQFVGFSPLFLVVLFMLIVSIRVLGRGAMGCDLPVTFSSSGCRTLTSQN